jgi:hypothetical protein
VRRELRIVLESAAAGLIVFAVVYMLLGML